jgi:hypothetical protein
MTQTNSRSRVKNDTVGTNGMRQLFVDYAAQGVDEFRSTCKQVIESSTGKRSTKDTFLVELDKARSKDLMLKKVTNYLLAGQGLGV